VPSEKISEYFDATEKRETREDLKRAINLVRGPKIAIDCGCGAGSDIAFLRANGFQVHAFDVEPEAIQRCEKRFIDDQKVSLTQCSFEAFVYPSASLVVADSSLCFCPEEKFDVVWQKIIDSILPEGVFAGSFVGCDDTMAGPNYQKDDFWPDVYVTTEGKIKRWFKDFSIESFTEHKSSGSGFDGEAQSWHRYMVVAVKESKLKV